MKAILLIFLTITLVYADDDFNSEKYQAMGRQQKFDKIWSKINENTQPYGWFSAFSLMTIFFENMKLSFDYYSDSMPEGRKKLIHSVGSVGLCEFVANSDPIANPYTGIFQGASHVLLRLSLAKQPDETKRLATQAFENFTPGLSMKILRDGVHAADTVAMFGVNGQASWDFFKNDFTTHIPVAEGLTLQLINWKFSQATKHTTKMGSKDWATYDQTGRKYDSPKFPYMLSFRPSEWAESLFPDDWQGPWQDELKKVPENFHLYDVMAMASPRSDLVNIGKIIVRKRFTASTWGDKNMFFRHQYWDDDLQVHPEWVDKDVKEVLESDNFHEAFLKKFGFAHP